MPCLFFCPFGHPALTKFCLHYEVLTGQQNASVIYNQLQLCAIRDLRIALACSASLLKPSVIYETISPPVTTDPEEYVGTRIC